MNICYMYIYIYISVCVCYIHTSISICLLFVSMHPSFFEGWPFFQTWVHPEVWTHDMDTQSMRLYQATRSGDLEEVEDFSQLAQDGPEGYRV